MRRNFFIRMLSVILVFILTFGMGEISAFAGETTIVGSGNCGANGNNVTWTLDSAGLLTISGEGAMADYSADSGAPWDSLWMNITDVLIEDGVTGIGSWAFSGCHRIASIEIPDGVLIIGDCAFFGCLELTSVKIGDSVTSIEEAAFFGCSALTDAYYTGTAEQWDAIEIDSGNEPLTSAAVHCNYSESQTTTVGSGNCGANGNNVTWTLDSAGLLTISGKGAIADCRVKDVPWFSLRENIKNVVIKDGVTNIGDYAFTYCSNLESITLPDSVAIIGRSVFYECYKLTNIEIPKGVTNIGDYTFYGCVALEGITLPDGLSEIGESAFSDCYKLTSIEIPNGVTSIGENVFRGCTKLVSIEVSGDNAAYSSEEGVLFNKDKTVLIQYPQGKTEATYVIPGSVTSIGDSAFFGYKALESIMLPDGLSEIGESAFSDCYKLTSIEIPNGVTSIGENVFRGCTKLVSIEVSGDNAAYSSEEGVLFNKDKTVLIQYPLGKTEATYVIPGSVTIIENGAFTNCINLESITLPDSLTSIEDGTFFCCKALENITLPDGLTSIGSMAFGDCSKLASIEIPDSVTSIGNDAFSWCEALEDIALPDGLTSIGAGVFNCCYKLASIKIPDSVASIRNYAFENCIALESITIPDSVTNIENSAFYGCNALTDVYYSGTAEQWNAIEINPWNEPLTSATVHYNYSKNQAVTGISLNKTSITLNTGEKIQLKATVAPETAANKNMTWKAGDTDIVQVSSDGTVTALAYGKTTVTAVTEDGGFAATCTVQTRFYDVTESQVTSGAITSGEFERTYWAADMGIVKGKKDTNGTPYFDRIGNTTRAQMAVMLYRLAKIIDPSSAAKALEKGRSSARFTDLGGVSAGAVEGIYWAVGAGITKGYTEADGTVTYRPNNSISRASTIIMLYRMAGKPSVIAADTGFTDVDGILDRSSDTYKAIAWSKATGITKGVNQANKTVIFDRVSNIQRRQMVTFINRYYQKVTE